METYSFQEIIFKILAVFALVFINAFFVAAEFSIVKVRHSRITQLISEGVHRARYVKTITSSIDSYLSACQLGVTVTSLTLGWKGESFVEALIRPLFLFLNVPNAAIHTISYALAFIIILILQIVIGELSPKSIAIQKAETIALWISPILIIFYKITYPIIWLLNSLSALYLRLFGIKPVGEHEQAHTEEEIRILVNESERNGIIDQEEKVLFDNVFEFSDRVAREAMVPRTSMVVIYLEDPFDEILKVAMDTRHTRYPVVSEDKDNIIGFIHVADLYAESKKETDKNIQNVIRDILIVPEFMELSRVLQLMKKNRGQIAIIQDEYGGTAGLLTLEDILEEIVGEIQDEFDTSKPVYEKTEHGYTVDGRMLISDINNMLNLDISNEDVDTIGGWVHMMIETELEAELSVGASFQFDNVTFLVDETNKNRITRLTATVAPISASVHD